MLVTAAVRGAGGKPPTGFGLGAKPAAGGRPGVKRDLYPDAEL